MVCALKYGGSEIYRCLRTLTDQPKGMFVRAEKKRDRIQNQESPKTVMLDRT